MRRSVGRPLPCSSRLGGWDPIDDEGVALLPTGHPWTGEMHVQTKSGDPIPVLLTYSEHPAPQPHRSRSSTSRRSAGVSKLGSFEVNLDTGEITRSDELSRILGHEPGMVMASEFEHIHPEDRPRVAHDLPRSSCTRRHFRSQSWKSGRGFSSARPWLGRANGAWPPAMSPMTRVRAHVTAVRRS